MSDQPEDIRTAVMVRRMKKTGWVDDGGKSMLEGADLDLGEETVEDMRDRVRREHAAYLRRWQP